MAYAQARVAVLQALRGLSARIGYGRLTGLVGPDGAGKTTLMRIMTGLLVPNAGRVTLAGYDVVDDNDAIHVASGYMPQRFGLYEDLSASPARLWRGPPCCCWTSPASASIRSAVRTFGAWCRR
jgi:ABC-type Na+ transport system ATPase subunit NatA